MARRNRRAEKVTTPKNKVQLSSTTTRRRPEESCATPGSAGPAKSSQTLKRTVAGRLSERLSNDHVFARLAHLMPQAAAMRRFRQLQHASRTFLAQPLQLVAAQQGHANALGARLHGKCGFHQGGALL
jgi:hypothetical protein